MVGHKMWVTSLSWEPYHQNPECRRLVSASKDSDLRIWDTKLSRTLLVLAGHTKSVTCVKWGGRGLIYSASQDRTIKVWRAEDVSFFTFYSKLGSYSLLFLNIILFLFQGVLCRTLEGHGHWVNTLALNVDYVLRVGPFCIVPDKNKEEITPQAYALKEYENVGEEKLVSGSDDFTLFLWKPEKEKKPLGR